MTKAALTEAVRAKAIELGFDRVAAGPASPPDNGRAFEAWLDSGYAGTMAYLHRGREERLDPAKALPGARSMIAVALNYYQGAVPCEESWKPVARYAWGRDYHDFMTARLESLLAFLKSVAGPDVSGRVYVDTGRVLERDLAARAGLGWIGKNTMLIHPKLGSWFFIGVILTTADLGFDGPLSDRCGRCTACLDGCPTRALVAPRVLDATRCISYLTIEHKGLIPYHLKPLVGERLFGCDLCQSVCPWNRKAPLTHEPAFVPNGSFPPLESLLTLNEAEFRERFRGSPLMRPKLSGILRNAEVALANRRSSMEVACRD
jgi:epoxyqueuosine reductase